MIELSIHFIKNLSFPRNFKWVNSLERFSLLLDLIVLIDFIDFSKVHH